jgi:repressor LexA
MDKSTTERLSEYMIFRGINNNMITVSAGLSVGQIGKAISNNSGINSTSIEKILHTYPEINPEWLLTGLGDMLKTKSTLYSIPDDDYSILSEPASEYNVKPQKIGIPLIPIEAMAGYGGGQSQVLELDCEYFSVPVFKGADFLIQIKGSSMYPKYSSGDIVACKKLMRDDVFFQWNKVYVIDTEQGALIKRIDIGPDDDHILIVSDNEKYKPFPLLKTKINAISIVMGVIRLE